MSQLFKAPSISVDRNGILIAKGHRLPTQITHLSVNGVGLISPKFASNGTRLEVLFEIPAFRHFQKMDLIGIVRNSHLTHAGYFLGIEFEDISSYEQELINDFIEYKNRLLEYGKKNYKHN